MGKIIKIGISKNKGEKLLSLSSIIAVKGKGLTDDRKFKDNNDKMNQLTLIESENISFFNKIANTDISQLDFRRNLVTENIKLNNKFWNIKAVISPRFNMFIPRRYKSFGHNFFWNFTKQSFVRPFYASRVVCYKIY